MVKRALMIAFHYPPFRGSSGIQRTLKFTQHLPSAGWTPIVLSANQRAYAATDDGQTDDIGQLDVHRSFALDASRHLALRGRYPALLALPDRWISWWMSAVPAGLRLIRRHRPDVIWSTYPIATAHLIGLTLHRLTGIPWIADQRDPMSEPGYPIDPRTYRVHQWIEGRIMARSAAVICTTPGAIRAYRIRFPLIAKGRFQLIENGFDEDSFSSAEAEAPGPPPSNCFRLLHSGIVYPSERNPEALFSALSGMLKEGLITPQNFRLVLRASGYASELSALSERYGIAAIIELAVALPYHSALAEMLTADGLLLLQASNCNHQIPAKLYEYLRARRPLLALTDPAGDSAAKLRQAGIDTISRIDSPLEIRRALLHFLPLARQAKAPTAAPATLALNTRAARTIELARLFDRVSRQEKL
jgi:hypothetical protein